MKEKNTAEDRGNNYEVLYKKEKEINEFSEKFELEKEEYEKEIKDNEMLIASLLEHM